MKKILSIIILYLFLISNICYGAASVTASTPGKAGGTVWKYSIRIVADGSGNIAVGDTGNPISLTQGVILTVKFIPDTGATQPDDSYNVDLQDVYGEDYFKDVGSSLSEDQNDSGNTRTPLTSDGGWIHVGGNYYIVADSMGADNAGYVEIKIKKSKN